MENILRIIAAAVIILGIINLFRMSLFLIGSHFYSLIHHIRKHRRPNLFYPNFSVVIPAYNEERNIVSCISSVLNNDYPREKLEVIVINDGSTDNTEQVIKDYQKMFQPGNLKVVTQHNMGKAHALNNGMQNFARGELVMCLDSDSYISKDALKKAAQHFNDPKVIAVAANVKIIKATGLLNLIQRFEYTLAYQMKRALTMFNVEYIIGGIGSTFRRNFIEQIGYYDTDTVTEDIDLTMKILRHGNKNVRVIYAADVIAYTQSVLTITDLIRQRFRWKWGRYQTFLKNKQIFFSNDDSFTKGLTWFYLPYAIFSDLTFLLEPIVIFYIMLISFLYHDVFTLLSACIVITFYIVVNLLSEETISGKDKLKMLLVAPSMYLLFYTLSYVEYLALIKSLIKIPDLNRSILLKQSSWTPVQRYNVSD